MSDIENLDNLLNKLNRISNEIVPKALKQGVWQATERVRAEAVLLCPVNYGELRQSIKSTISKQNDVITGTVFTNKEYAKYVEFGTGKRGRENHKGISPEGNVSYTNTGWYIPAEEFSDADILKYHLNVVNIKGKDFVYTEGQPAQPFLYPAIKNNKKIASNLIKSQVERSLKNL